ncbi:MAG: GntP family permease [Bilophila wadsworthia]
MLGLDPMAIIKTSCKGFRGHDGRHRHHHPARRRHGADPPRSGCTREIANTMLRLCGREKSALALNLTGYIISIPVFFDAAFVILIGLIREMAREGKLALNTLVTALVVGLTCTHALVIPTPGPVAVAGNMGADIGWFIVYGVLIALPASLIGGVLYGKFLGRKSPIFLTDEEPDAALVEQALAKSDHPSGALGIAIIFLPIMLIFFANILNAFLDPASSASRVVSFFGNTNIVLLITVFVAYFSLREHLPEPFDTVVSRGAESVAPSSPSSARAARSGPSSARAASAPPSSTSCRAGASRSSCSASS